MITTLTFIHVIFITLIIVAMVLAISLKIFSVFEKPKSYVLDIVINFLSIVLFIFVANNVFNNPVVAENIAMTSIVLFIFGNMIGILKAILNIIDPSIESKN